MNLAYKDFKFGTFALKEPESYLSEINKQTEAIQKEADGFKLLNVETLYSTSITGNIEKGFRVWYQMN